MSARSPRRTTPPQVPVLAEPLEHRALFTTTVFQIDPAQSVLKLSGSAFGITLDEQSDGSLAARYEGTLVADVTADTIRLLGGGAVVAETKGRFDPGGAAGNYGAAKDGPFGVDLGKLAVRDLALDLTSSDAAVAGGAFATTGVLFTVDAGKIDYNTVASGSDTESLVGSEGGNKSKAKAKLVTDGGVTTLTIPVDVNIDDTATKFRFRGTLVATQVGTGPIIDANGPALGGAFAAKFNVGQSTAVAAADPGLTVTDLDGTTLSGGRVTLTNLPDGAAESLSVTTAGTGVTASAYDPATGTITLSGTAPLADYQTVLRSLQYANAAASPTLGDRTITLTLSDPAGDGPAATSVIDVHDPEVATLGVGGVKAVRFTDADGSVATFSFKGPGTATVRFVNAVDQVLAKGTLTVTGGTDLALADVAVTGGSLLTKLSVKAVGGSDGLVVVPSVTADGSLGSLGGKSMTLAGPLTVAGAVSKAEFRNVVGSTLSAASVRKLTVYGTMTDSTVTLTAPADPLAPAAGTFAVAGAMTNSTLTAAGGVGTLSAGSMVGSRVYVGRVTADTFPDALDDFADAPAAAIKKVKVGSASGAGAPAFANSVIAARALGSVSLSAVATDNGGTAFGLVADTIASLSAKDALGQPLKVKSLDDPAVAAATLAASGFAFGDLAVRVL
ncbi:MAG TPA: hypothetical protein VF796_01655 [Humisphaera sp.]